MKHPATTLVLLCALGAACAPPPSEASDLLPCTFLRRQVCGANDECVTASPDTDCERCKAHLCEFVRALEDQQQQFTCFAEWRSQPAYPVCRFPDPVSRPPTPPFVTPIYCERECSLIPYPPWPDWAP